MAKPKPSVPNPCSVCGFPIFGSHIGTGDGSMKNGGSFAHPECYWRSEAEHAQKLVRVLRSALKEIMEAEWMVTHDWGGDRDAVFKKCKRALRGMENSSPSVPPSTITMDGARFKTCPSCKGRGKP